MSLAPDFLLALTALHPAMEYISQIFHHSSPLADYSLKITKLRPAQRTMHTSLTSWSHLCFTCSHYWPCSLLSLSSANSTDLLDFFYPTLVCFLHSSAFWSSKTSLTLLMHYNNKMLSQPHFCVQMKPPLFRFPVLIQTSCCLSWTDLLFTFPIKNLLNKKLF